MYKPFTHFLTPPPGIEVKIGTMNPLDDFETATKKLGPAAACRMMCDVIHTLIKHQVINQPFFNVDKYLVAVILKLFKNSLTITDGPWRHKKIRHFSPSKDKYQ